MSAENNSLNIEAGPPPPPPPQDHIKNTSPSKWPLLLLCCLFVAIGIVGGPLLVRFYYLNGGTRKWLISFLQTAAFPILIPPISLLITLHASNPNNLSSSSLLLEPKLILSSACMGMLYGFINFLYSQGLSYLPASTSTLLSKHSVSFWIRANGDRPAGVSTGNYWLGFFLTLLSACLTGVMWPTVELSYRKATRALTQATLLQYQLNVSVFATLFCLVGMAVSRDFQAMGREANEFAHGKVVYCTILVAIAVVFQTSILGSLGLVFFAGSLFSCIYISVLVPITEVASFVAYHESFNGEKGMSLALSLWAFASYCYGQYKS
ncbi:hypothetical protein Scep_026610 [Stephania cephalantha]|uniref:Probable purine permease n=1 Tax=Stephania cephalantha TaxID=152367 RepID=A0AAP0EKI0_9MAGN